MTVRIFWPSLLWAALSVCSLAALDLPRQSKSEEIQQTVLREEQAGLRASCRKMLDLQVAVQQGIQALHKDIEATADKQPRPQDKQIALRLAERQNAILAQVTPIINQLEADGAAVSFPEIFRVLRDDMKQVQRRLENSDAGPITQARVRDIIDILWEMIDALKG